MFGWNSCVFIVALHRLKWHWHGLSYKLLLWMRINGQVPSGTQRTRVAFALCCVLFWIDAVSSVAFLSFICNPPICVFLQNEWVSVYWSVWWVTRNVCTGVTDTLIHVVGSDLCVKPATLFIHILYDTGRLMDCLYGKWPLPYRWAAFHCVFQIRKDLCPLKQLCIESNCDIL